MLYGTKRRESGREGGTDYLRGQLSRKRGNQRNPLRYRKVMKRERYATLKKDP